MHHAFRDRWLTRFELSCGTWRTEVRRHLRGLPFADPSVCGELLGALFNEIPRRIDKHPSEDTLRLADAFGCCCLSFWDCGSVFPAWPEDYAKFLLRELYKPASRRSAAGLLTAELILGAGGDSDRCGFNALRPRDPDAIRESERCVLRGDYDAYLKAGEKYREYLARLRSNLEFRRDWRALKETFPLEVHRARIIHRSLIPERNWFQDGAVTFSTAAARFQAAFDLFCWKYFLWGMKGNTPLLLKPSVVFTPLGTQIFVPGYMSFDPKRDLDLRRISRLHKARGVLRQGGKMSPGREELEARSKLARGLDRTAKTLGLRGSERLAYICRHLRLKDTGDYRQIRLLLRTARAGSFVRRDAKCRGCRGLEKIVL